MCLLPNTIINHVSLLIKADKTIRLKKCLAWLPSSWFKKKKLKVEEFCIFKIPIPLINVTEIGQWVQGVQNSWGWKVPLETV